MKKLKSLQKWMPYILLIIILTVWLNWKIFDTNKISNGIKSTALRSGKPRTMNATQYKNVTPTKSAMECKPVRLVFIRKFHRNFKTKVALYSFPGSGNTWLRHLIQEATGFYTGSIYKDRGLYKNGFRGEMRGYKDGSCIVYKTHRPDNAWNKAIILIRNPYHALKAYFNYRSGRFNKMSFMPLKAYFIRLVIWKRFVWKNGFKWKNDTIHFLKVFKGPVFLVLYEDLQYDLVETMESLVKFLNLAPDPKKLSCMYHNQAGLYHRKARNGTALSDIYNKNMVSVMNSFIEKVSAAVGKRFPDRSFDVLNIYTRR